MYTYKFGMNMNSIRGKEYEELGDLHFSRSHQLDY